MSGEFIFSVQSAIDGGKYDLQAKDPTTIVVSRIKRELHKYTSIPPEEQIIQFNGASLSDG
eukprot:gene6893-6566_t